MPVHFTLMAAFLALALLASPACTVIDGDTIRCGSERIRLTGIDAPERGACLPRGRVCVAGDGEASKRSLAAALSEGEVAITRLGHDRYGRTLAVVRVGGRNMACVQLTAGQAFYREDWDTGRLVARDCPTAADQRRLANHDKPG
ncbi:thermonuclease family protein [Citromicrobium bathyomarinum]|uniref:thermonuclease family protein n=1 Tax=Citromicrobium bathyomarinum TaxID=72174 RepID=UPI00315AEE9C